MSDTKLVGKVSASRRVKRPQLISVELIEEKISARCEQNSLSEKSKRMLISAATAANSGNQYFADSQALDSAIEWMVNLEKGNSRDMRGNYFIVNRDSRGRPSEWMSYEEIVDLADQVLGEQSGDDAWERIYHLNEVSNRKRIGPKGLFKPASADLESKIKEIWSPKQIQNADSKALERALGRVRDLLPANSVNQISVDRAVTSLPFGSEEFEDEIKTLDPTTNSGPPWFKRRWSPAGYDKQDSSYARAVQVFNDILKTSKSYLAMMKQGKNPRYRAMAAQRLTQRGPDQFADEKYKRLVVALEKANAVVGKTVTANLIPALRQVKPFKGNANTFCALMDAPAVDISVQTLIREAQGRVVLSTDYSGFDQTQVPDLLVRLAECIATWVRGGEWIIKDIESMVYHTSMLSPVGYFHETEGSMKSGFWGTNLLDSLYSLLVLFYGEEKGVWVITNALVQGDDGCTDGEGVTPEVFSQVASELNLVASEDKQFYEEGYVHYLQRLHKAGEFGGIYSVYRTLGSIVSYERFKIRPDDWNPHLETIQTISRLENAAFSPKFPDLLELISAYDKYTLGREMTPDELIAKAGGLWTRVVAYVQADTINAQTMSSLGTRFANSAVNRELRGVELPPPGSHERFHSVYGDRVQKVEAELGISASDFG
jgi:hypothetical protein